MINEKFESSEEIFDEEGNDEFEDILDTEDDEI